jgi:putative transposase
VVSAAARREAVAHLQTQFGMSERRACAVVGADRKSVRYRARRADDGEIRGRLRELAAERRRFGYRRLHVLLRRDGITINRKKTQRLYREEGLTVRRRRGRKRAVGARAPAPVLALPNQRWSLDFVHDQLATGRRFRVLNIVDDVTRECLRAIVDTSIFGQAGGARAGRSGRGARCAHDDRQRQWHRAHLERGAELVRRGEDRVALHRAG